MSATMTADELARALALRDLTDPSAGPHAIQLVVDRLERALSDAWAVPVRRDPGPRIVTVADNYDRLRYSPDAITRDRRYSRYVGDGRMLRSHTTARIPALLASLDSAPRASAMDVVLSVPGICYRRDLIDRRHVGEPHQLDLWRVRGDGRPLSSDDLEAMVGLVVAAVLPGVHWWTVPGPHPYTLAGREIYVRVAGEEVEVGECGLAHPSVLTASGLPVGASGLAMGLGLDRLAMLAKGVPDIRLLRSADPRIAAQMTDLSAYREVSRMPATHRDLSVAVADELDPELLGDRVRALLGPDAAAVEEVAVLSETAYALLPPTARLRMGVRPGQKNVLLRVALRELSRTLTSAEANEIRDRIYAGLHEGTAHEWSVSTLAI
ncbi:MAG TPA: hypothetical protein VGJ53_03925 [Micromonosporaceae bacterium]|jgi:phenylalanyl-tRNA synthetase alpha chain